MRKILALTFFVCFAATPGSAQGGLHGKWATDRPADSPTNTNAPQSVKLEVAIDSGKANGFLEIGGLGGTFYTFADVRVMGNKVQFLGDPRQSPRTWTIELVDDNTVMVRRGQLPLVGSNVLELISALGGPGQPTASAQPSTAISASALISGIVQDRSRALIPGVTVTATNPDTGAKVTTISNAAGRYGFPNLTPGTYTLSASLPGFETSTISNISIVDAPLTQDFTLEIRGARTSANPSPATCSQNGIEWCALLHRAK